jgi:hypothetical protein
MGAFRGLSPRAPCAALAVAVTTSAPARGPRAASRRAFRCAAALPRQPVGVEALAAVKHARAQRGRLHEWDARVETSCIAMLEYLWRRGRGEKWAGGHGSARYGCSLAQLVIGVAEIMGWQSIPRSSNDTSIPAGERRRRYELERATFVRRHRASVQRWLDWLADAGLVSHTPQQDEEGIWWRTIIELRACPQLPAELLAEASARRSGWTARERRRAARGRRRDLTAILRRARLTRTQRRARSAARRRALAACAERQRVRVLVAQSLEAAVQTHLRHPFGAETPSQDLTHTSDEDETCNRGLTRAPARQDQATAALQPQKGSQEDNGGDSSRDSGRLTLPRSGEASNELLLSPAPARMPALSEASRSLSAEGGAQRGATASIEAFRSPDSDELRWAVYREVLAQRSACDEEDWEVLLRAPRRRIAQLAGWPHERPCERWRLIEAWTHAAHGPYMAVAGGFRLAFWSEQRYRHGPRLDRALARYRRFAHARPPGWPENPIAAWARYCAEHMRRQEGPEHGMAVDVARFDALTKQMSAYAHYSRPEHLELAAARAQRRQQAKQLAEQVNARLAFRAANQPAARLRTARELLDSPHPAHHAAGRALYAAAQRHQRLAERDQRLLAGRHPGPADGRYLAACRYAQAFGLPEPPAVARQRV